MGITKEVAKLFAVLIWNSQKVLIVTAAGVSCAREICDHN